MKFAIPAFVCLFLLVVGCRTTPLEEVEVATPELDGQSIFRTVFFNLGDAAEKIPSFKDNVEVLQEMGEQNPEFLKNYVASVDRYIEEIERTHPAYFDQLKKAVATPDLLAIKKAMELGNLLLLPTIIQSNLDAVQDESFKRELQNILSKETVDYQNVKQLETLSSELLGMVMNYQAKDQDKEESNGRNLNYDLSTNYNYSLDYNLNLNYDLNYNYNYNLNYNLNLNYNYNYNLNWAYLRTLNWNYNYNWNYNWNYNYTYNIIAAAEDNSSGYDNYRGEELIREIAAGFNQ